ncbi:acetate kinase [Actinocrinis puniceicyclus]|uniref:Acetate kinase n=1 Tax=Actinocrinis puniceicyclus TaxID=977794 RepID=A0A8J8BC63_9ACTN|nr:acetate kinase [Actinocrinis puniceicyclus]MBS2963803.1 acetate kinase [Actinocrinis puniceicyclus]
MGRAVLVFNAGSSSVKYQLIDLDGGGRLATGLVDRIGEGGEGLLKHRAGDGPPHETRERFADHAQALDAILAAFKQAGPDLDRTAPVAVGHRVVHGGTRYGRPTLIDDAVLAGIRELSALAPLHNPANAAGIEVARKAFPDIAHVAVFDTAFHRTLPAAAYTYAVPREWREEHSVRRYGFHGTSHQYVARRAAALLGKPAQEANLIVLHLGNGASACAVEGGRSVETSMGLTPLEGLVMGTRSGDLDPAVPEYLRRVAGLDAERIDAALNHDSGLRGLAGSNDLRDLHEARERGDEDARLALDVYCHRIKKYVGAYYAVLGRLDAVVFTAGVGENDPEVRARSLAGLERLGITLDDGRNRSGGRGERFVSPDGAPVPVLVVPTDEELEIAVQALEAAGLGAS